MFKLLRNNLRPEHRLFRVLTSTVGEITMVMVGVLLALWVQNWNDDRKDVIKEGKLLREMRHNLDADLNDCRDNIVANQRYLHANTAVLKQLTERTPFNDTLRVHYANIFGNTTLVANTSAYDNLKSIGFNLIRNDSLRGLITKLYSERYPYIHNVEFEADGKMQWEQMLPAIHSRVAVDTMWVSGHPLDELALMDDDTFKGLLRTNIFLRDIMLGIYSGVEKRILVLQQMIDRELATRE
ncbi:MAG: DUF6090 family protein [Flavobacteriales bacterium]